MGSRILLRQIEDQIEAARLVLHPSPARNGRLSFPHRSAHLKEQAPSTPNRDMKEAAPQAARSEDRHLLAAAIRDLGLSTHESLPGRQTGESGSYAIPVVCDGVEAFLKLAPQGKSLVSERAEREARFFRELGGLVPLKTPEVLRIESTPEWLAIVLRRYKPLPRFGMWPGAMRDLAVRQLARLHARYWDDRPFLDRRPWLSRPPWPADPDSVKHSLASWKRLLTDSHLPDSSPREGFELVVRLGERLPEILSFIQAQPRTLCHGDSHPANLLCDDNEELVWADWHEVRRASGPEDLAHFLTRCTGDGQLVDETEMLDVYTGELRRLFGPDPAINTMGRAVAAAELLSVLVHWPGYVDSSDTERIMRLLSRARVLALRLELQ